MNPDFRMCNSDVLILKTNECLRKIAFEEILMCVTASVFLKTVNI